MLLLRTYLALAAFDVFQILSLLSTNGIIDFVRIFGDSNGFLFY